MTYILQGCPVCHGDLKEDPREDDRLPRFFPQPPTLTCLMCNRSYTRLNLLQAEISDTLGLVPSVRGEGGESPLPSSTLRGTVPSPQPQPKDHPSPRHAPRHSPRKLDAIERGLLANVGKPAGGKS